MARAAPIVAALVVLLSLASPALCAEAGSITIAGTGSTLQESVITEWLFSFQLLRPVVAPDYTATGSSAAVARLQGGDESIDWASTDAPSDAATLDKFPKITQYPILAAPIAFLINIPDLPSQTLNLTRQAVVGIFSGVINRWDDPEIIAYNPALTPTQRNNTILVVVRRDGSGTSNILLDALNQFNSTVFPNAATNQFPTDISSLPNFITKIGSTGVAGEVLSTQYSIGYTALSFAQVDNIAVALVQNKRGQFVSPFPSSAIDAAIAATPLENRTNIANLIDLDEDLYYPLTSYTYIQTLNLGSGAEVAGDSCDERIQTFRMFRWALTDPFPINAARLRAYFPLPPAIAAEVIGDFERELACRGDLLLRLTRSPQHSSKLFEVILAFTMFAWFLSLIAIAYSWWSSSRAKNPLFYAVCLLLGCSLAYLSSVFFYLLPEHTWTCELRKWLLTNGLTLLLGVMFARGWQLHALKSGPRVIQTSKLLLIVSIITGGQLILLVIWTAVDPWESQQILINQIDRITAFRCHCDHMIIWLLLELGFFLILLSWGIYVVYATWRNRAAVDSRWTLIAVYNTLIAIFIVLPLIVVAVDSDDWVFYVSVPTMLLSVVSCVLSIYGAAILRRIWDYVQKSSGSGSQEEPGKVSSLRMTVGGGV